MLARRSLLIFSNNALGAALGLVSIFFMGRYLTNEAVGMFGFAFSVLMMVSLLTDLGLEKAHLKRVSEGMDLARCLTIFAVLKIGLATIVIGGAVLAAGLWNHYQGFHDATTFPIFMVVGLYWFLVQVRAVPVQTFNAFRYTAKSQTVALVENLVKAPLIGVVALSYGYLRGRWVPVTDGARWIIEHIPFIQEWSPENAAIGLAFAHVVGITASLVVSLSLLITHKYPFGALDLGVLKRYIVFALPIAPITFMGILGRRIDTLMVGYFWSSVEVSFYFMSERIITMLLMIPMAVGTLFFPLISSLGKGGDMAGINAVARSTQRMMSLLLTPMSMLILIYTVEIMHIFLSNDYIPARGALRWLVVYVLAFSYTSIGRNIIMGLDRPAMAMKISLVTVFTNLVLNVLLIPPSIKGVQLAGLGADGAAMATALSQIFGSIIAMFGAKRLTGNFQFGSSVVKHMVVAAIVGTVFFFTKDLAIFGGLDRWYLLGFAITLALLAYVAGLVLWGELTRRDLWLAVDIMDPRRMVAYIRDEVRIDHDAETRPHRRKEKDEDRKE